VNAAAAIASVHEGNNATNFLKKHFISDNQLVGMGQAVTASASESVSRSGGGGSISTVYVTASPPNSQKIDLTIDWQIRNIVPPGPHKGEHGEVNTQWDSKT